MNNTVKNKEKLQNTKKIKDILKRFSIFTFSFIFILMSFNFSFAITEFDSMLVSDIPSNIYSDGVKIQTNSNKRAASSKDNTYYFYANKNMYFVNTETCYVYISYNGSDINESINCSSGDGIHSGYYFGNASVGSTNYYISDIPVFSSVSEGISALDDYLQSLIPIPIKYPYTFQNGYLFVFDLGSSGAMYSFDLSSKSEEYSNLGDYPFPNSNQSYWFSNSLPEIDDTTIPDSNATVIHWLKGKKQNIFGQTQDMIATISGTSSGRYLYIYNPPAHYKWIGSSNPTASETVNYPITINGVSTGDNFYIYDSVARLFDYNQGGKVQGIVGEMGYGSVASDGAITVTTSDGAIYNQVSGGSTDISGANGGSIAENINGLKQTLDNFVNQFIQLLSAPISHIQQLIQSSYQFFDVFSQLFEWLPSELSSVIVSGLIIMVVIGVIKMLL